MGAMAALFSKRLPAHDCRASDGMPRAAKSLATIQPENAPVAVRGVRFDPLCAHLAASYENGTVRLWKIAFDDASVHFEAGPRIGGRPGTTGYGVDFNSDGTILATGSSD